jgi:hypothetical protein
MNFLIASVVTYPATFSEPVSIKQESNNYSRIEMVSIIWNIDEQFENTYILLYGIKCRANLG